MRKSCLVVLILLAVLLVAASVALRRCYLEGAGTSEDATPGALSHAADDQALAVASAQATFEAAASALDNRGDAAPDGLALVSLRPLVTDQVVVYGLAASEGNLYAVGGDGSGGYGLVYVVDASTLDLRNRAVVPHDADLVPGGIQVFGDAVWVWSLSAQSEETHIVILDGQTLTERARLALEGAATALTVTSDGIFGAGRSGDWFYRWDAEGKQTSRRVNTTGAVYSDCEMLAGSLVCSGLLDDGSAVLDVLDPDHLSLLARHEADSRTQGGEPVLAGAWAYLPGHLLFVPAGGDIPIVWNYALDAISLEAFIPSVAR